MAFGTVLFTLLGQGTTIQFLLARLGLTERPQHRVAQEINMGKLFAAQAGFRQLEDLYRQGLLPVDMWDRMRKDYQQTQQESTEEMELLFLEHPELERAVLLQARREALQAEGGALSEALRRGLLSNDVYDELRTDIDYRLEAVSIIQNFTQSGVEH
jgi:CPA1 family monovalent cation:H+ antiporter